MDDRMFRSWLECLRERKRDTEITPSTSRNPGVLTTIEPISSEDTSEIVRRSNESRRNRLTTEDILENTGADLYRWLASRAQQGSCLSNELQSQVHGSDFSYGGDENTPVNDPESEDRANLTRLYPKTIPSHRLHPDARDFSVIDQGPIGKALLTLRRWQRGDLMARFDGVTVPEVMLHTLQKSNSVHLWDPHFIGNLAHSCNPNVILDMAEHEMWAIQDIEPGTVLSMDYASTEDQLFRTFQCKCTAPGCRGEVTGRKQRRSGCNSASPNPIQ